MASGYKYLFLNHGTRVQISAPKLGSWKMPETPAPEDLTSFSKPLQTPVCIHEHTDTNTQTPK